jgi:hypothetical protein
MPYWLNTGLKCCGQVNKIEAYVASDPHNQTELMQAISIFGGALVGINFPTNIINGPDIPFVWEDVSGPTAGHEILFVGYQTIDGNRLYDFISWGQPYRIWDMELEKIIEEVTAVLDPVAMNAMGTTPAGYDHEEVVALMAELKAEG